MITWFCLGWVFILGLTKSPFRVYFCGLLLKQTLDYIYVSIDSFDPSHPYFSYPLAFKICWQILAYFWSWETEMGAAIDFGSHERIYQVFKLQLSKTSIPSKLFKEGQKRKISKVWCVFLALFWISIAESVTKLLGWRRLSTLARAGHEDIVGSSTNSTYSTLR